MVNNLTSRLEKKQLIEAFNILDQNGDGTLTKAELEDGAKLAIGENTYELVNQIFQKLDKDESGKIDFTEFLAGSIDKNTILSQERINATFKTFDADGDQQLSKADLRYIFGVSQYKDQILEDIISELDENQDGMISQEEFYQLMMEIKD